MAKGLIAPMDKELLGFVGAGLTMLGCEHASPPPGAVCNGHALIELLLKFGRRDVAESVVDASRKIWRFWRATGMPPELALTHLAALPAILDRHRPSEREIVETLGAMREGARPPTEAGRDCAMALAARIISRAEAAGEFDNSGLSRQIAFYLIERLVVVLQPHRELLWRLRVPIAKHFEHVRREDRLLLGLSGGNVGLSATG